jgi:hypothetical protein
MILKHQPAFRLAVATMLAAVVLAVVPVGYPFWSLWRAQRPAVAEIEQRGGQVLGSLWAPKYVTLADATDSDVCELVEPLQTLRSLHKITITGSAVTKDGVICLRPVKTLAVLDLRDTKLSSADSAEIQKILAGVEIWGPDLKSH